jgi:hypothetical protein
LIGDFDGVIEGLDDARRDSAGRQFNLAPLAPRLSDGHDLSDTAFGTESFQTGGLDQSGVYPTSTGAVFSPTSIAQGGSGAYAFGESLEASAQGFDDTNQGASLHPGYTQHYTTQRLMSVSSDGIPLSHSSHLHQQPFAPPSSYISPDSQHPHLARLSTSYQATPISPSFNSPHFIGALHDASISSTYSHNFDTLNTPTDLNSWGRSAGHETGADAELESSLSSPAESHRRSLVTPIRSQLARFHQADDLAPRTFQSVLNYSNILTAYHPLATDSPLTNPICARIFQHFVQVLGPALSIFERHPPNPSSLFSQGPVPSSQQNLWTYKIPTLALKNPALLQAVMAVSSLHISKLQGQNSREHVVHYSYAIQMLGRSIARKQNSGEVANLGATLLLGYYEVMSNGHVNWTKHLMGSLQLIKQIDYKSMVERTRYILQSSQSDPVTADIAWNKLQDCGHNFRPHEQVDSKLISTLVGREVANNGPRKISDDPANQWLIQSMAANMSRNDIDDFQLKCDLYWWFAKQDVFQSMLSRTPLT